MQSSNADVKPESLTKPTQRSNICFLIAKIFVFLITSNSCFNENEVLL